MPESQEMLPVMYCNSVNFTLSLHEFAMILGVNVPSIEKQAGTKEVKSILNPYTRVIMSPTHFKRFIEVGTKLLKTYEETYGNIPTEKSVPKKKSQRAKKTK